MRGVAMTGEESDGRVQHGDQLKSDYEGLTVKCPYCEQDDSADWVPIILLKQAECPQCQREFDVRVVWDE
jgi:endogenous inhibitor of DNA gyrase (YacG/DUF329 family)